MLKYLEENKNRGLYAVVYQPVMDALQQQHVMMEEANIDVELGENSLDSTVLQLRRPGNDDLLAETFIEVEQSVTHERPAINGEVENIHDHSSFIENRTYVMDSEIEDILDDRHAESNHQQVKETQFIANNETTSLDDIERILDDVVRDINNENSQSVGNDISVPQKSVMEDDIDYLFDNLMAQIEVNEEELKATQVLQAKHIPSVKEATLASPDIVRKSLIEKMREIVSFEEISQLINWLVSDFENNDITMATEHLFALNVMLDKLKAFYFMHKDNDPTLPVVDKQHFSELITYLYPDLMGDYGDNFQANAARYLSAITSNNKASLHSHSVLAVLNNMMKTLEGITFSNLSIDHKLAEDIINQYPKLNDLEQLFVKNLVVNQDQYNKDYYMQLQKAHAQALVNYRLLHAKEIYQAQLLTEIDQRAFATYEPLEVQIKTQIKMEAKVAFDLLKKLQESIYALEPKQDNFGRKTLPKNLIKTLEIIDKAIRKDTRGETRVWINAYHDIEKLSQHRSVKTRLLSKLSGLNSAIFFKPGNNVGKSNSEKSPINVKKISTGPAKILLDWNRIVLANVSIDGETLETILKRENQTDKLTPKHFKDQNALDDFFKKYLLKHVAEKDINHAVAYLRKILHQGGILHPVSSSAFLTIYKLSGRTIGTASATQLSQDGSAGQAYKTNFITTKDGFYVSEVLDQHHCVDLTNGVDILPDPGNKSVFKAQATLKFTFRHDKPKLSVISNTIEYGSEAIKKLMSKSYAQQLIEKIKNKMKYEANSP